MYKNYILLIVICFGLFGYARAQSSGMLFVVAGQSNAVGQGDSLTSANCSNLPCYEYDAVTGRVKPLKDPMGQKWRLTEPAGTGSVGPAFAKRLHELTKNDIYLVSTARGGASCHINALLHPYNTWDAEGELFGDAIRKIDSAVAVSQTKVSGIIWMQGERDANAILDKKLTAADYKLALKDLIARFRVKYGADLPLYIVQTGFQQDRPTEGCSTVRSVQQQVCDEIHGVYMAYSETGKFEERGWFKDNVHYSQVALNDIGVKVAECVAMVIGAR